MEELLLYIQTKVIESFKVDKDLKKIGILPSRTGSHWQNLRTRLLWKERRISSK